MRQTLYLIADEMRGMASLAGHFASNVYEVERAQHLMTLAAKIAALADEGSLDDVRAIFDTKPWLHFSPAIGVEAFVLNPAGELLLLKRKDNSRWAVPGGLLEVGEVAAEGALRELWEEAGLRGRVVRLLGIFDAQKWGSRLDVHALHIVFQVECVDFSAVPGIEMIEARYFSALPGADELHYGHEQRIPKCLDLLRTGETYFDPADSLQGEMPMHQRPNP